MSDLGIEMHNALMDADTTSLQDMENLQAEMWDYNAEEYVEDLPTEEEVAQRAYDARCDDNYSTNRSNFEEFLMSECGYSRNAAEESSDGEDKWLRQEYALYLENNK